MALTRSQQDTLKLIRRARIILSVFLVSIGLFLIYMSQTVKKTPTSTETGTQKIDSSLGADDIVVGFKDGNGNRLGQGVLVSNDGLALTNKHIVEGVEEETVVTYQGEDYIIDYVGKHAYDDYALVRIYDINTACVNISTKRPNIGTTMQSILPQASQYTFTIAETLTQGTITTTAPIQSGMSGTPLFIDDGSLVGLIQARDERFDNTGKISLIPETINARITKKAASKDCKPVAL